LSTFQSYVLLEFHSNGISKDVIILVTVGFEKTQNWSGRQWNDNISSIISRVLAGNAHK